MVEELERTTYSVHVLASGSRGNATLVKYKNSAILIDAGISCKRLVEGLEAIQVKPAALQGIFITHEHSDHIAGITQFLKRFQVPVYTKKRTWQAMGEKVCQYDHYFVPLTKRSFTLGDLTIEAFPISHDAADPLGFSCYGGREKLTVLTDTGFVDQQMLRHLDESTFLVLETNHDLQMLRFGNYTPSLKRRVAGPTGHLNNEAAAQALLMMKRPSNLQVVMAHRSEQNNTMAIVDHTMHHLLTREGLQIGKDISLYHGQPKEKISMYEKE